MSDPGTLLEAIDLLYAAALDADLWPAALDRFSALAGGLGTVVLSLGELNGASIASASLAEAARSYEANGWWQHDILRERGQRLGRLDGVFTDRDVVSREIKNRHPLFQEFWREHGLGAMASYSLRLSEDRGVTIAVQRQIDRGDFERPELDVIGRLGPHAARALVLAGHVARSTSKATSVEQLVARLNLPAIIVDRRGRVHAHNQHAQNMLGRDIDIHAGVLRGKTAAAQRALDRALSAAFTADARAPVPEAIPSRQDPIPTLVQAIRLAGAAESPLLHLFGAERALVTFVVPESRGAPVPTRALQMMGLTAAEARIAIAIGSGQSPAEAAETFHVSLGTVRVQLKSIFGKLGLHRQSDLVRLVSQLSFIV